MATSKSNQRFFVAVTLLWSLMASEVMAQPAFPPIPPPPGKDKFRCFSGDTTVQVQGKATPVKMSDLKVGDALLTSTGAYATLYAWGHEDPFVSTEFLEIITSSNSVDSQGDDVLEITGEHLLYLQDHSAPVRADSVRIGSVLKGIDGPATVTHVGTTRKFGMYAPLTTSGDIVVNGGIAVSSYVSLQADTHWVNLYEKELPLSQQQFVHVSLAPFRLFCQTVSQDFCQKGKTHGGMPYYIEYGVALIQWVLSQSVAVQILALSLSMIVTGAFYLIEVAPIWLWLAGMTTYLVMKKRSIQMAPSDKLKLT